MPYIMTLMSLFATDSLLKRWAEKQEETDQKPETGKKIVIKRYRNRGAMLNIGEKNQHLIALLSLVFSAFMTGIFAATLGMKGRRMLKTGLAMILGGAYSNTYDRLRRTYVVDYFSFHIVNPKKCSSRVLKRLDDKFSSIVFNLADFGIMIGAMLLMVSELGN